MPGYQGHSEGLDFYLHDTHAFDEYSAEKGHD
jgi:hypothetical protein